MIHDMFHLIIFLVVIVTAQPPKPFYNLGEAHDLFKDFLQKHGKVYNSEEYLTRLDIFKQNLEIINERKARHPQNEIGINRFTDLTSEEKRQYVGFKPLDASRRERAVRLEYPAEAVTAPEQFDWRDHNAVTHVKDQFHCQSSWVFSAIGNIEGQYALKHKKLIAFSEQQGIDCTKIFNCVGGWPDELMLIYHFQGYYPDGGVVSEEQYPYTGIPSPWKDHVKSCPADDTNKTHYTRVQDYQIFAPKDEETLKQLLYETGPLAVALEMTELYEYTNGIYVPWASDNEVDHTVLLVGYGIENGTMFWTLKNSWGAGWGEKGYFRLIRGKKACSMGLAYTATCTVS